MPRHEGRGREGKPDDIRRNEQNKAMRKGKGGGREGKRDVEKLTEYVYKVYFMRVRLAYVREKQYLCG